jgi:hypothetical protein
VSDPRWKEWSGPVLKYLVEPRSWNELTSWGKVNRVSADVVRHILAWLSIQDLAEFDKERLSWRKK